MNKNFCPCCGRDTKDLTIEISDMTQDEFIKRKLELGYINLTVFGYTIDEIKAIIDDVINGGKNDRR
jgi:hypothetical protein